MEFGVEIYCYEVDNIIYEHCGYQVYTSAVLTLEFRV